MKEVGVRLKVGATGLENVQALSKELDGAGVATTALDAKAAELAAELKRLGAQQALIDAFKRQKQAVADTAAAMETAKAKAAELGREIGATESPTKKQEAAFAKARAAAREASDAYTAQRLKLQDLRGSMTQAGVSSDSLAEAQLRVRRELQQAQEGIRATADWAQRMATAERAAAQQASALSSAAGESAGALKQQGGAAQQAAGEMGGLETRLRQVAGVGLAGILGSQTAQMLKGVGETADAFANLQARVKLVTGEGPAFNQAMEGIAAIALRTNSNLETTGDLFARLARAGKEMGLGQEQALALTESVNQAVQLSGASAAASDAAITQLVQGLQGGVLRGDEFNSVMEQAPRLAQALAAGLGVTTGELRKMAEAGELSAETVIRALQSQSAVLAREFGTLPATIGRAIENLSTQWKLFVGDLNGSTGATAAVADGINALAGNLDEIAGMAQRAGSVLLAALAVQGVGALRALAGEMGAVGGAAALLTRRLDEIPKVINIAVAVTGFEVGFQIGQMLYENSALARKLGVAVTEFFTALVSDLQFVAEAAKAVFTDDTIGAAFDRYKQRAEEQRAIFQGLYEDAEKSPEVVRAAAAAAAQQTARVGATAQAAGAQVAAAGAVGAAGLASVKAAADTAAGALGGLVQAGKDASRAQAQLGADVRLQAEALVKMALAGSQAAQAIGGEIPQAIAKLSGPELEQFRAGLVQALAQSQDQARKLADELQAAGKSGSQALAQADRAGRLMQQVLVDVGVQAAKSLGVDVSQAANQVSAEFARSADNLSVLIRSLPALAKSGVDTGEVVTRALAKMVDGAKTQAEIDLVVARLQALGKQGQISGAEVAAGLDKARERAKALRQEIEDAKPGIQSLEEAVRRMGVQTRAQLEATAGTFRESWDAIRQSTELTMAEKIKAFARYRDAAVAANDGVESSEVALQRQTLETQARVAGLGDEFQRSMGKADKALAGTRMLVTELGEQVNEAGERVHQMAAGFDAVTASAQRAENAALRYGSAVKSNQSDKDGFALGADGQRISAGNGTLDPLLAKAEADTIQARLEEAMKAAALASDKVGSYGKYYSTTGVDAKTTGARKAALQEEANKAAAVVQDLQRELAAVNAAAARAKATQDLEAAGMAVRYDSKTGQARLVHAGAVSYDEVTGAKSTTYEPGGNGRTVTINLTGLTGLGGSRITVASDADAARLEALLRQLEAAASRSGP